MFNSIIQYKTFLWRKIPYNIQLYIICQQVDEDATYVRVVGYFKMYVNMDSEKWGKVRETTFSEFAPTLHARANVHFLTHVDI